MPETLRDVPPPLLSSETSPTLLDSHNRCRRLSETSLLLSCPPRPSPTLLDSHNRCRRLSETSLLLSCPPRRPRLYWTLITGAGDSPRRPSSSPVLRDVPPPLLSSETSPTLLDSHNRCRRLSETSLLLSCPPRRPRLYWTLINRCWSSPRRPFSSSCPPRRPPTLRTLITGAGALQDVPSPPPVLRDVPPTLRTLITGAGALRDVPSPPPVLRDVPRLYGLS